MLIGVVGPCAAGKSTLIAGLTHHGYSARHIAQEHSYVQTMWLRITHPDLLIYLDVSFPATITRRKMNWDESEYAEQIRRLQHARDHADLVIQTDGLGIEQVLRMALDFLEPLHS
jgi:deoxyadenosine/deoxycytidine kinase